MAAISSRPQNIVDLPTCCHWWHRKLSWRQLTVPPVTTNGANWRSLVFSGVTTSIISQIFDPCLAEFIFNETKQDTWHFLILKWRRYFLVGDKNTFIFRRQYNSNPWWRHQMETFSALLAICAGNSPVPGELPTQRPVTRGCDVFFDLFPNKRLSKQ